MSIASLSPRVTEAPLAYGWAVPGRPPRDRLRAVPAPDPSGRRRTPAPLTPPRTVAENVGVPTLHRTVVDYANFDHAASTPALEPVKRAVDTVLRTYASVHRGAGHLSQVTTGWFEQARDEVGAFVATRPGDQVVFTRNTTDALNLLARCLPRHTTTYVFESEHHATLLPWGRRTVRLPVPASPADALALLEDALAEGDDTVPRLVVVAGASNVTGELWPVAEVAAVAHRHGARVALDAAGLAPHRRIDLAELDVDYVAFSGHKVYAPFGAGALVGRADWLDAADPYLRGGGATAAVTPRSVAWQDGPARHEGGTPNAVGAIALAAACATLREHWEAVEEHEDALAEPLRDGLARIDGVTTYSIFGPEQPRVGIVSFTVDGLDGDLVSTVLSAEHGIGVRDGKFCAHLLVDALLEGAPSPAPTTAVRASLGLATTTEHVDRLLRAVAALAADGPAFDYVHTDDGWQPVDDPRDLTLPRPW